MKKSGKRAAKRSAAKKSSQKQRKKTVRKAVAKKTKSISVPAAPVVAVKKRVVITGGTGFVGHHLAHELASKGYHVIVLTHGETKQSGHDNETTVHWDGQDVQTLIPYVEGAEAIVNLAGEPIFGRWTQRKRQEILDSRVRIGKSLIQVIQLVEKKPNTFIQASAVGYYGSSDNITDEQSPAGEGFLADVCGQWEASTDATALLRIRHVITRFGIILGTDGGAFPRMVKPFRYCVGGPVGSGNQYFSYIHVVDAIRALVFLIENDTLNGAYNLTAPHPCTNREFSTAISRTVHRPMLFGASAFTMKLLYGDMATETILANQRVVPKRLEQAGFHFLFPTAEQAIADLLKK